MDKIKLNKRKGQFYEYSISIMGREEVLLTNKELLQLYEQITDIIVDNDEMIG